ncbi:hypothetical protein [Streptomyces sp. NPDC002889]|uniref:hypothetical protein n=1 Tax=Streptomyces sp. NPDC002889 TaxID=3364669 RepID=UPI0036C83B1D
MITTRVCIDHTLGPFDCKLDPANRWNGWLSPHFTLDSAHELSAQTLRLAAVTLTATVTRHQIDDAPGNGRGDVQQRHPVTQPPAPVPEARPARRGLP